MNWMHVTAAQFRGAYGREPRMTGPYDEEGAQRLRDSGWETIEVTCLEDEVRSYVKGRQERQPHNLPVSLL